MRYFYSFNDIFFRKFSNTLHLDLVLVINLLRLWLDCLLYLQYVYCKQIQRLGAAQSWDSNFTNKTYLCLIGEESGNT